MESLVHLDKANAIHIDIDNVLNTLYEAGVVVPPRQFEETLQKILERDLVGKAEVEGPHAATTLKIIVGDLLYRLSAEMAFTEKQLFEMKMKLQ